MKSFQYMLIATLITSSAINAGGDKEQKKQKPSQTTLEYANRQMFKDVTHVPVDIALDSLNSPHSEPQANVNLSPITATSSVIAISSPRSPILVKKMCDFLPNNSPLTPSEENTGKGDELPKFSKAFAAQYAVTK